MAICIKHYLPTVCHLWQRVVSKDRTFNRRTIVLGIVMEKACGKYGSIDYYRVNIVGNSKNDCGNS